MNLEYCDRANIRLENAAAVHKAAVNREPNHPRQPDQAHGAVAMADAAEAEVDSDAGLEVGTDVEVGAEAETWAQAEPGPRYEVEPGFRMGQRNTSAASLKSALGEPVL
jgi:hypothetical protein